MTLHSTLEPRQHLETLSKTYPIAREYRSMKGPRSSQQILLEGPQQPPELLWITGYRASMVGPDGKTPMPQEFMCHSNLNVDVSAHRALFGWSQRGSDRLFTLSQGQPSIHFPDGFGIPIMSHEPLTLTTQVLNLNPDHPKLAVRQKVLVEFVRDRDLKRPLQPLFMAAAAGRVLLDGPDGYFGVEHPDPAKHGEGCLPGTNASEDIRHDPFGRTFTGHWIVPPGRQVNRTLVTHIMNLPFDTTIHYIAVHLHPFAESLTLRDLTSGQTLFTSHAKNFADRIGLEQVEALERPEGIPVYRAHEYELVSVYHNPTPLDHDAMAVMYLYLLDREFQKSRLATQES